MAVVANLCGSCGQDFGSLAAFDQHRVGKHAYTYSQGCKMDPIVEDGRRCLRLDEYERYGLVRSLRGTWSEGKTLAAARVAFQDVPSSAERV